MEILNHQTLRKKAEFALNRGREPKKVVAYLAIVTLVLSVAGTLINLWLDSQISDYGGLGNLNTRAIYSTAQTVLPMALSLISMCLNLGYQNAMMRISRGQYADQTDLKVGFQRFWPLMRLLMLQVMLYTGICLFLYQAVFTLYSFTPWAQPLLDVLYPYLMDSSLELTEAAAAEAFPYLIPFLIMYLAACALIVIPLAFRMRMANYCLLDNPRTGAMAAMRESRIILKGKCRKLLRVDLSLWPYYLLVLGSNVALNGDLILAAVGVEIPVSWSVVTYVAYGVSLLIQFAATWFLRNTVETTYLIAYEQIREKPEDNGVVLGNIFNM